ncbi:MAG: Fic family protein [Phycisphaerales bacterium]
MLPWPSGSQGETTGGLSVPHPGDADSALRAIAARVADKRKAPQEEVRRVVIALCRGRFLSAEVLGKLLRRNPDRLRNLFLSPMVRAGLLKLQHPETPNSPTQAYTASEVA